MPTPETDDRFQKAQLWVIIGVDNYTNPLLRERIEITVRWEDKTVEILDPKGVPIRIDAFMHSTKEIPTGSILWKGCLEDLPTPATNITNLMQVAFTKTIPDVKNRAVRKTYLLKRFSDRLPTVQAS